MTISVPVEMLDIQSSKCEFKMNPSQSKSPLVKSGTGVRSARVIRSIIRYRKAFVGEAGVDMVEPGYVLGGQILPLLPIRSWFYIPLREPSGVNKSMSPPE